MIYQPWKENPRWEQSDPTLKQLKKSPVTMPHTGRLVDAVALRPPGVLFVRGPRQAGKSTFLRQYVCNALSRNIAAENIGLLEAESLDNRHDLLAEIEGFRSSCAGYALLLVDEITALDSWWRGIKRAADSGILSEMLVICTGSSAMDLSEGADLLPGRRGRRYPLDFELLPLRYVDAAQYLELEEYILTGGFPWAVNEYLRTKSIPPFVYELYGAWIQGALVKRNHSTRNLPALLNYIARRSSTPLSVSGLARDCDLGSNHTAESYLSVLEYNYALLNARWSEPGSMVVSRRKNRKFFAADPLLFHLFHDFGRGYDSLFIKARDRCADPVYVSKCVETLVAAELRHRPSMVPLRYFLSKKEIDFVGEEAFEVKYQNRVNLNEFEWVDNILPKKMRYTVITRQTRSRSGRLRAVPLKEWLTEKNTHTG